MRGRTKDYWGARARRLPDLADSFLPCGCGASQTGLAAAAQPAKLPAGTPVVVGCEPNQRTLVRPSRRQRHGGFAGRLCLGAAACGVDAEPDRTTARGAADQLPACGVSRRRAQCGSRRHADYSRVRVVSGHGGARRCQHGRSCMTIVPCAR